MSVSSFNERSYVLGLLPLFAFFFLVGCQDQSVDTGGEKKVVQVSGKVQNAITDEGLAGKTILVSYKKNGEKSCYPDESNCEVIEEETDANGKYTINIPERQQAVFSYVGDNGYYENGDCENGVGLDSSYGDAKSAYLMKRVDTFISGGNETRDIGVFRCAPHITNNEVSVEETSNKYEFSYKLTLKHKYVKYYGENKTLKRVKIMPGDCDPSDFGEGGDNVLIEDLQNTSSNTYEVEKSIELEKSAECSDGKKIKNLEPKREYKVRMLFGE